MFDGVLHRNSCRVGAGNARERRKEVFYRLGNRCQVYRRAGSRDVGDGGRARKLRHTVHKAPGAHVHIQPVEVEEVRSQDSLLDVRHHKNPTKAASQTQTDGEAPGTVCGNAAAIDSRQRALREGRVATVGGGCGEDAHFSTSVNKEAMVGEGVLYVQQAADVGGASGVGRGYWLALSFPDEYVQGD